MDELTTRIVKLPTVERTDQAYLIAVAVPPGDDSLAAGDTRRLGGYTKIGRLKTNSLVLLGDAVSREHCSIELRHDGYHLLDEESANGTIVSGKRVRDAQLHRQETLHIGDYRFIFWQGGLDDPGLLAIMAAHNVAALRSVE